MLYVVATPIGNLEDMSPRARRILSSVNYIACEDTRHSGQMVKNLGSGAKLISFHAHSPQSRVQELLTLMHDHDVALISDAGTSGISDPGMALVAAAHRHHIAVSPIPGPSATIVALSVCGFSADHYQFLGFLPKKKGRKTVLELIAAADMPTVVFESPHRIRRTLQDFRAILDSERGVCVCRELTKQFEEVLAGTVDTICSREVREQGEYVIVIDRK